jgi:hypothetical protein
VRLCGFKWGNRARVELSALCYFDLCCVARANESAYVFVCVCVFTLAQAHGMSTSKAHLSHGIVAQEHHVSSHRLLRLAACP